MLGVEAVGAGVLGGEALGAGGLAAEALVLGTEALSDAPPEPCGQPVNATDTTHTPVIASHDRMQTSWPSASRASPDDDNALAERM
jgi:hypothetical protein